MINVVRRLYVDDDGGVFEITNLIDHCGEETEEPEDAAVVVIKLAEDQWLRVDIRNYQNVDSN